MIELRGKPAYKGQPMDKRKREAILLPKEMIGLQRRGTNEVLISLRGGAEATGYYDDPNKAMAWLKKQMQPELHTEACDCCHVVFEAEFMKIIDDTYLCEGCYTIAEENAMLTDEEK